MEITSDYVLQIIIDVCTHTCTLLPFLWLMKQHTRILHEYIYIETLYRVMV